MSEPNQFDPDETELPGIGEPDRPTGSNEAAARRTIRALKAADLVDEQHAVMLEALLTAARQLDRAAGSSRSKDYGVANLLAQLRETYLVLIPDSPEGGEEGDPIDRLLDELAAEERRRAGVRDPAEP